MFPTGSIVAKKANILAGHKSCGCSSSPLTETQYKVLVRRRCEEVGYLFKGWKGRFKGIKSKLLLENKKNGHCWDTTSVEVLMKPDLRPSSPLRRNAKATNSKRFDNFCTKHPELAPYLEEDFENQDRVFYTCEVCSVDKFTMSGTGGGVFRVWKGTLETGGLPCRCSSSYRYTKDQQEVRVTERMNELSGTFLSWEEEGVFSTSDGRVLWLCKESHSCNSDLSGLLFSNGCDQCRKMSNVGNGCYKDRVEEQDYLYFINFDNQYLKDGRSFNVKRRLKELAKASKLPLSELKVLRVFTGTHQEVFDTEQEIHVELRERGFSCDDVKWSNELFTMDSEYYTNQLLDGIGLTEVDVSTIL